MNEDTAQKPFPIRSMSAALVAVRKILSESCLPCEVIENICEATETHRIVNDLNDLTTDIELVNSKLLKDLKDADPALHDLVIIIYMYLISTSPEVQKRLWSIVSKQIGRMETIEKEAVCWRQESPKSGNK